MTTTKHDVIQWGSEVLQTLAAKEIGLEQILKDPRRVFNLDEANYMMAMKGAKVIALKGKKNVYDVSII